MSYAAFTSPRISPFSLGTGLPGSWMPHNNTQNMAGRGAPFQATATVEALFPPAWQEALRVRDTARITQLMLQADGVMPRARRGITPLHAAASVGCVASVRALLRAGAAPSVRREDGRTPLHRARAAVQSLLLAAGADVGARDLQGRVPLHTQQEVSAELLTVGLNVADHFGFTPLHLAALAGAENRVQWLLDQGADPSVRSTRLYEHRERGQTQERQPEVLFKPGQRAYDLARFQYNHTRWTTSRHTRTLELLDQATPRRSLFSR